MVLPSDNGSGIKPGGSKIQHRAAGEQDGRVSREDGLPLVPCPVGCGGPKDGHVREERWVQARSLGKVKHRHDQGDRGHGQCDVFTVCGNPFVLDFNRAVGLYNECVNIKILNVS